MNDSKKKREWKREVIDPIEHASIDVRVVPLCKVPSNVDTCYLMFWSTEDRDRAHDVVAAMNVSGVTLSKYADNGLYAHLKKTTT